MENKILEIIKHLATSQPTLLCFDDVNEPKNRLTYSDLEQQSNALSSYFTTHFSGNKPILIHGGLIQEMLVTFIACMKSGHPYVPVDKYTPFKRIQAIYEEAQPISVVSFEPWTIEANHLISWKMFQKIISENAESNSSRWAKKEELIYIIFTSGTTGKPKGVQISYDNLMSFNNWILDDFSLSNGQRYLCQAPFSFDLSVMDLYPSLLTGSTLVPMDKTIVDNFPQLFQTIPKLHVNVWVSTPSLIEVCLINPDFNQQKLPGLSHFLFCGEELPHLVAEKLVKQFPDAKVFNTYGPTEATVAVTNVQITPTILKEFNRLPLGKVKDDTTLYIFNEHDQSLAEKEVGEIIIAGPSISSGYFNNEEKTVQAFFTYNELPAYRTGDAGYLEDGHLFYQGRLDAQIKWHGYRIELGDIEHHLSDLDLVRSSCVVPKYNQNKVQQLIAYVALHQEETTDPRSLSKELKNLLKEQIMDYMIPQKFIFVDTLPLTSNGKIDRKKLSDEVNNR